MEIQIFTRGGASSTAGFIRTFMSRTLEFEPKLCLFKSIILHFPQRPRRSKGNHIQME
jgi:hypothetical protein